MSSMAFTTEGPGAQRAVTSQVLVVHWAVSYMGVHSQCGHSKPSLSRVPPGRVLPEASPPSGPGRPFLPSVVIIGRILDGRPRLAFRVHGG